MNNIVAQFLKVCKVPYTTFFSNKLFREHPYNNNFLGIKQMLSIYGIESQGMYFPDKDLSKLSFPCILHLDGDFMLAICVRNGFITYIWKDKQFVSNLLEFSRLWDGCALVVMNDISQAVEPDYKKHLHIEISKVIAKWAIYAIPVFLCIYSIVCYYDVFSIYANFQILLVLCGIALCFALVERQIYGYSKIGDKICSSLSFGNCSSILSTDKSKFSIYTWSEIGFGYFIGRLLCYALAPYFCFELSVVCCFAMIFGLWSMWQQIFVLKNVCIICTLVQVLVWVNGLIFLINIDNYSYFDSFIYTEFLVVVVVLLLCMLLTQKLVFLIINKEKCSILKRNLNLFKFDYDVFLMQLHKMSYVNCKLDKSRISFGNIGSKFQIIVFTNPFCYPCAQLHRRLDKMLEIYQDKFYVQYVFMSWDKSSCKASKFLIAVYLQHNINTALHIYKDWYGGNKNIDTYIGVEVDINNSEVEAEFLKHQKWVKAIGISATPTILVNGYFFPVEYYDLEDLMNFN